MTSYLIRVTCIECGRWWSKKVQVEGENIVAEALSFLRETASRHGHGPEGNWSLNWEVVR